MSVKHLPFSLIILFGAACGSAQSSAVTATASSSSSRVETPAPKAPSLAPPSDTVLMVQNFDEAKQIAQRDDKQILMVFAGSDWCRPCVEFKRSVLDNAAFAKEQKDAYVLLYLDFPAKKRNQLPVDQKAHNDALAEKYNTEGLFPRIYLFDAQGSVKSELKFTGEPPAAFLEQLSLASRS